MIKKLFTVICLITAFCLQFQNPAGASDSSRIQKVYLFDLKQEIMPPAWRLVQTALESATEQQADYVLIHLNTYGGMVDIADSIRTALLNAKPEILVFIDKNAASAGALISIACDSIYMASGATIGAATVVDQTGAAVPDKYQSYMRGMMRTTAEAQGRDPGIAEAFVDPDIKVPGVSDSGKVLTFTTSEAIKHGFCEGQAATIDEVLTKAGIEHYEIVKHQVTGMDEIIGFLINPVVSGILLMIIIGGIYFELQTPGVGFPIIASLTAAILYFAPLYLEGLAEHWEIFIFVVGVILLAVEVFVIPGFGVAGIAGITLVITGLTLSLLQNVAFDFTFTGTDKVVVALFRVLVSIITPIGLLILFGKNIIRSALVQQLVLKEEQESAAGYSTDIYQGTELKGKTGIATTPLKPSGKIKIDEEWYDAVTEGDWIEKDEAVQVYEVKGNYLVVRKVSS